MLARSCAGPARTVLPSEVGNVALRIDDADLPVFLALVGIGDCLERVFGRLTGSKQFQTTRPVSHVDKALAGDGPGIGLGVRHRGTDGEHTRRRGHAPRVTVRVKGHNGKGVGPDLSRRIGRRRRSGPPPPARPARFPRTTKFAARQQPSKRKKPEDGKHCRRRERGLPVEFRRRILGIAFAEPASWSDVEGLPGHSHGTRSGQ